MMIKRFIAACVLFLFATACAVGGRHTPDSKLEQTFFSNEAEFNAFLAELNKDGKLEMLRADEIGYAGQSFAQDVSAEMERLGFSRERWAWYRQQIRKLGIVQITRGNRELEFRVDQGSLLNGDSYKGYMYSPVPPAGHQKASLDVYRRSEDDKTPFGGCQVY